MQVEQEEGQAVVVSSNVPVYAAPTSTKKEPNVYQMFVLDEVKQMGLDPSRDIHNDDETLKSKLREYIRERWRQVGGQYAMKWNTYNTSNQVQVQVPQNQHQYYNPSPSGSSSSNTLQYGNYVNSNIMIPQNQMAEYTSGYYNNDTQLQHIVYQPVSYNSTASLQQPQLQQQQQQLQHQQQPQMQHQIYVYNQVFPSHTMAPQAMMTTDPQNQYTGNQHNNEVEFKQK